MKTKLLLSFVFTLLFASAARADVEVNEKNFPDRIFREWLLGQEFGADSVLTDDEIAGVTQISVPQMRIQSLRGIEYFTALISLSCSENQLRSLDVSKNTQLKSLSCDNNQLTALDVSNNTQLLYFYCNYNRLTTLDVSKNTELVDFTCYQNELSELDVTNNLKLDWLDCSMNKLTILDVSKNTELGILDCGQNWLTTLDVSNNKKLYGLYCYYNGLTSLDLWENPQLMWLNCGSNQLTELDVSENPLLEYLYCYNNKLKSIDISKNDSLKILDCDDNLFTTLNVVGYKALEELTCSYNQLTTLNVSGCTALTKLSCYGNQITDEGMDALIESLPTIEKGDLNVIMGSYDQNFMSTQQVETAKAKGWTPYYYTYEQGWNEFLGGIAINEKNFPDEAFREWLLDQTYGAAGFLVESDLASVTKIAVINRDVKSLKGIEYFTNLKTLNCYNNQLTELDLSKNTALSSLYCYKNQLTSINLSGCTSLSVLNCYQNQFKGETMDSLIESLPTVAEGKLRVIYDSDEENVMTIEQVAAAKAKGWTPYYREGSKWQEYAGSDPANGVETISATANETGPIYNLSGQRLSKSQRGLNIVNGRMVLVK